jgi:hypothetical protein
MGNWIDKEKLIDDLIDAYVDKMYDSTIDFTKSIVDIVNKHFKGK